MRASVHFGKYPANVPDHSIIFFPCSVNTLGCGIAGIVAVKGAGDTPGIIDLEDLEHRITRIEEHGYRLSIGGQAR